MKLAEDAAALDRRIIESLESNAAISADLHSLDEHGEGDGGVYDSENGGYDDFGSDYAHNGDDDDDEYDDDDEDYEYDDLDAYEDDAEGQINLSASAQPRAGTNENNNDMSVDSIGVADISPVELEVTLAVELFMEALNGRAVSEFKHGAELAKFASVSAGA